MPARRINMECGRHIVAITSEVIVHPIGRKHRVVIIAKGNEGPRCYAAHLAVCAIKLLHFLSSLFAKQVVVRASMGKPGVHRNYWIEQYLEVGRGITLAHRCHNRCQMAAGR